MIIVLLGYMASGKSYIGQELVVKLDYDFIDLDAYIEAKEKMSINDIFSTKGEIYFRKIETNHLTDIISDNKNLVLALGGGTPCYDDNMRLILSHKNCISIYLKASIQTLKNRLLKEIKNRPLVSHLSTDEELTEFIGKHLFERSAFYNLANFSIATDDRSRDDIVENIVLKLF